MQQIGANLRVDRLKTKYGTNDPKMLPPGTSAREVTNIGGGPRVARPSMSQLAAPSTAPMSGRMPKIRVTRPRFRLIPGGTGLRPF